MQQNSCDCALSAWWKSLHEYFNYNSSACTLSQFESSFHYSQCTESSWLDQGKQFTPEKNVS